MIQHRDQTLHDAIVRSMVAFLQENGHVDIHANIPGHPSPDPILVPFFKQTYTPDITVENTLTISQIKNRWITLDRHAHCTSSKFNIVASKPDKPIAEQIVTTLKIEADIWTV